MATDKEHKTTVVGVISDTHGLLRPQALETLAGVDLILHAGDIGRADILDSLTSIAPVIAVRGNVDGGWAASIPETVVVEIGNVMLYMLHDISRLDLKPESANFAAVIYGHSHKPANEMRNGVRYFNPGSAGPRRFRLPISVGKLLVDTSGVRGELIELRI